MDAVTRSLDPAKMSTGDEEHQAIETSRRSSRLVDEVVAALRRELGDKLVALASFGSRARGDPRPGSDYDLFVVARELPANPFDRQLCLREMLPLRWGTAVSLVVKTPQEFEDKLLPLYLDLALDAKVLYDPESFLTSGLARVRRIIDRDRLQRRRRRGGWVWDWSAPEHRRAGVDWT